MVCQHLPISRCKAVKLQLDKPQVYFNCFDFWPRSLIQTKLSLAYGYRLRNLFHFVWGCTLMHQVFQKYDFGAWFWNTHIYPHTRSRTTNCRCDKLICCMSVCFLFFVLRVLLIRWVPTPDNDCCSQNVWSLKLAWDEEALLTPKYLQFILLPRPPTKKALYISLYTVQNWRSISQVLLLYNSSDCCILEALCNSPPQIILSKPGFLPLARLFS